MRSLPNAALHDERGYPVNIGEAAHRSGVSAKMLRFIKRSRGLGFSMAEVAELVGMWTTSAHVARPAVPLPRRRAARLPHSGRPGRPEPWHIFGSYPLTDTNQIPQSAVFRYIFDSGLRIFHEGFAPPFCNV